MATTTLETLEIAFKASMGNVNAQLAGMQEKLNGVAGSTNAASVGMTNLSRKTGMLGTAIKSFAGIYLAREIVKIGSASLTAANNVVESESLFKTAMGSMATSTRAWSESLSDAYGLNAYSLRSSTATYYTMINNMADVTRKKSQEMSQDLVKLASDSASFYNVDVSTAETKFRSGMAGESEPLKQWGIMVDETTVKNYAYANGIAKQGEELSITQKVLARYGTIMEQTSVAQGDLARTIDSPVNQIRILKTTVEGAGIALGQAFQPIQAIVLPLLNSLAKGAKTAASAIAYFVNTMPGLATNNVAAGLLAKTGVSAQTSLAESLDKTTESYNAAGKAAGKAAGEIGLQSFDEVNLVSQEAANGGGLDETGEVIEDTTTKATNAATIFETVQLKVLELVETFKKWGNAFKDSLLWAGITAVGNAASFVYKNALKPLGDWLFSDGSNLIDTLTVLGASLVAFKIGTGLTKLLSVSDAATGATGLTTMLKGLASVLVANKWAILAASVVAGIVAISAAVTRAANEAARADLVSRFGEIALSMDEINTIVSYKIKSGYMNVSETLGKYSEEAAQAVSDYTQQRTATEKIMLIVDLLLKPDVNGETVPLTMVQRQTIYDSVQATIDAGVNARTDAWAVVHATFATDLTEDENGETFVDKVDKIFQDYQAEAKTIESEISGILAKLIDEATDPGDATAMLENLNVLTARLKFLNNTINGIISGETGLEKLKFEFSAKDFTAETVQGFITSIDEQITKALEDNTQGEWQKIGYVNYLLEIGGISQADADAEKKRIHDEFAAYALELKTSGIQAFDELVSPALSEAYGNLYENVSTGFEKLNVYGATPTFMEPINSQLINMFSKSGVTAAASKGAKELVDAMEPNYEEWKKLAGEYEDTGMEIPKALSDAITGYESLKIVAGGASGMMEYLQEYASGYDQTEDGLFGPYMQKEIDRLIETLNGGKPDVQEAVDNLLNVYLPNGFTPTTPKTFNKRPAIGANYVSESGEAIGGGKNYPADYYQYLNPTYEPFVVPETVTPENLQVAVDELDVLMSQTWGEQHERLDELLGKQDDTISAINNLAGAMNVTIYIDGTKITKGITSKDKQIKRNLAGLELIN